jgi:hypothetical protein
VLKYIFIILLFLFVENNLSAQDNSVKGFIWYSPFIPNSYLGVASLGYTKDISKFTAFDVNANYNKVFNPESNSSNVRISFIPSIRYYPGYNNVENSGLWLSGYPVIGIADYSSDSKSYRTFEYGLGIGIGFRYDISKNKEWFMDIGLGASYRFADILCYNDKTHTDPNSGLYSVVEEDFDYPPSELLVPRIILQIGYKF